MDPFETRLKSLLLRAPSESFGQLATLAAVRENAGRPESPLAERRQSAWKSKAAAVLLMAASALVAFVLLSTSSSPSIALAQIVEKIASAHSLSFDMEVQPTNAKAPAAKGKLTFGEPNNMRVDMRDAMGNDAILITNLKEGKTLLLSPKVKIGFTASVKASDQSAVKESMLDGFRKMAKEGSRPLGKKQIDGIDAEGFELDKNDMKMCLWANAKTGDPVLMEIENYPLPPPYGRSNAIARNFKIDEKLDPSLFSVEPPAGYLVLKSPLEIDLTAKPSDLVVSIFRKYSTLTGGNFPPMLNDQGKSIQQELEKHRDAKGDQSATKGIDLDLGAVMTIVTQLNSYLAEHKQGVDYLYYPGGKLGEKDRIVFWSKDDKTGQYTAVYGDLRSEKIEKDKLPPPPVNTDAK